MDTSPEAMYDTFSQDYDRFVAWDGRLDAEMPFIQRQLEAVEAQSVLDAACGTGMHAIALAEAGYDVVGTDVSSGMIEQARENAAAAGVDVQFSVAGFGAVSEVLGCGSDSGEARFDGALCLGNSLPHVLSPDGLAEALDGVAECLKPDGLLLIQNRNFDAVLKEHDRWMGPQYHATDGAEWLFLRIYDFESDGLLTFNVATLRRQNGGPWQQSVTSTKLWPMKQHELKGALTTGDFEEVTFYGDMEGSAFDAASSPNLVATARVSD